MKENKNNDPKNILNDIRSRNSQSNYNEDQQRRMFFSHIFSLFDDDKNTRRSGKSDKSKHSKSRIDHEDNFKSPKARTEHDSHRKISLNNKDMEPDYDSFESTFESYLNSKRLSNNQYNDENESKHKRKNKGKRQAKINNSRPESDDEGDDAESLETVSNKPDDGLLDYEFMPNKMIKYRKRKNTYDEETFDSQTSLINSVVTSTPVSDIVNEMDSSETAYLVRTPSFNYYPTDVTYVIPDDERSIVNEESEPINNIESSAIDINTDKDADVFVVPDEIFNNADNEVTQESVTFSPDVKITGINNQNAESVYQEELNIPNDNLSEDEPVKVIFDDLKNNQSYVSDIDSKILNDLVGKDTRRMNYIDVKKDMDKEIIKVKDISTIKEELETPEEELKVSKVYGEPTIPNVRNPLSARIKLDLLIQLPSQIDVGNI